MTAATAKFTTELTAGTLGLRGELTFATAAAAWPAMRAALSQDTLTQLDLGQLQRSDIAGLACVLALVAEAAQVYGCKLSVARMPAGMQALARVCEVDTLMV